MAESYRLHFSPSSTFNSRSSSSPHFKLLNFPSSSHKLSYLHTQSKTPPHASSHNPFTFTQHHEHPNSPEAANPHHPHAKSQPLSKNHIWVNPRSSRAKHLRKKKSLSSISGSSFSSLLRLAKSLDSCSQQDVPKILNSLGGKIVEHDAVFVLDNMLNPEIALIVLKYFQQKIKPQKHVVLYNVTLKLFREVKDFKGAEKLFDEMIQTAVLKLLRKHDNGFARKEERRVEKKIFEPFLDLCVSSLRRGHANLLCIVPILSDVPEGTSLVCSLYHIFCQRNAILPDVRLYRVKKRN